MKRVYLLLLLLTAFGLFGTAQWVPALSKPLLNSGLEEYEPISGKGVPALADFIGWAERDWLKTEQARIRLQIGNQDAVVGDNLSDFPISWNVSGDRFWSDRFSVSENVDLNATYSRLFIDNTYAGAAGNEGNPRGVPEPDTMILLGSGLLALAGIGRRFTRT